MDDYKKEIIELVRDRPLLWDPKNPEYHNKDQRKQVWGYIDSQCLPAGTKTTSKAIWESLSRSFSNALRRKKNKPSCSEAGSEKNWKFEKHLMFLLPVKTLRKTSGNVPGPDLDTSSNEDNFSSQSEFKDVDENSSQIDVDTQVEATIGIQKEAMSSMQKPVSKRKEVVSRMQKPGIKRKGDVSSMQNPVIKRKEIVSSIQKPVRKCKAEPNFEHDDTPTTSLEMMNQRHAEKSKESPRLNFFRSLMPSIDNLDEEQFLNFQIDVIKALQKQKRVSRLPGAYQQQQSPSPCSDFSEASGDSYSGPGYQTYRPLPGPSNQQEYYPERASTSYNSYEHS